jgi:hypothetical protein
MTEPLSEAPLVQGSESVLIHCDQKGKGLGYDIWVYIVQQTNNPRSIDGT